MRGTAKLTKQWRKAEAAGSLCMKLCETERKKERGGEEVQIISPLDNLGVQFGNPVQANFGCSQNAEGSFRVSRKLHKLLYN